MVRDIFQLEAVCVQADTITVQRNGSLAADGIRLVYSNYLQKSKCMEFGAGSLTFLFSSSSLERSGFFLSRRKDGTAVQKD
ncbi:uncharacterized [Tachysurus ichikawai]